MKAQKQAADLHLSCREMQSELQKQKHPRNAFPHPARQSDVSVNTPEPAQPADGRSPKESRFRHGAQTEHKVPAAALEWCRHGLCCSESDPPRRGSADRSQNAPGFAWAPLRALGLRLICPTGSGSVFLPGRLCFMASPQVRVGANTSGCFRMSLWLQQNMEFNPS